MSFQGQSLALTSDGLAAAASTLNVQVPEIWAVLSVETKGTGFLPDRRPQILFERHYFSRLTNHQYDATHPGISNPIQGGYGAIGANQYLRLQEAYGLNQDAALQSASWGMGQIMGANHKAAGFDDAASMVTAMTNSEDAHLAAMVSFLIANRLDRFLAAHDWASFARGYNGPNYAINHYDDKLNTCYQKFQTGTFPDLNVRAAQIYLQFKGFNPNGIDGVAGPGTASAVKAFQTSIGVTPTGIIDDALLAALKPADA
ncbi:N-acetylmuramidase domain-containing protein [Granulicella sibirica]|uniref:Putative phage-encoded peptidoglycan binding protein n=1 Tax=Granulicella sibirica TaxID=2479048 RepID=A0A4Q0T4A9_9BACT|nr:N-acetylmuramidase domain-containing protein [Granulicella sibirica]RXH58565.1 putative phage-encoded peptidoglycan binding protein [Granulicella sibirica]